MSDQTEKQRALFNNGNLTDEQIIEAIDWAIFDLTALKTKIQRTRPGTFGTWRKQSLQGRRLLGLMASICRTLSARRQKAAEAYEASPEVQLLKQIFGDDYSTTRKGTR